MEWSILVDGRPHPVSGEYGHPVHTLTYSREVDGVRWGAYFHGYGCCPWVVVNRDAEQVPTLPPPLPKGSPHWFFNRREAIAYINRQGSIL